MAKVICKLPNASGLINGVKFVTHKLGMISEEIADDVAAEFTKIEGYVRAEVEKVTGGDKGKKGAQGAQVDKGAQGEVPPPGGDALPADPAAGGSDAEKK